MAKFKKVTIASSKPNRTPGELLREAYANAETWQDVGDVLNETPAQSLEMLKREWEVDEFDNNLLPQIGSEVFFQLASSDSWESFTVTGFSVLNSFTSTDHRVFIHGVDSDGFKNVRLIQDIKENNND